MRREWLICVVLAALTLGVYWPVRHHDFIQFDDPVYVSENPIVSQGFTKESVRWAVTSQSVGNYHPLTSLSHILDVQLFGVSPGAHHFVNLALHTLAAVVLFLALRRMTNELWVSAFAAGIFALHPIRVESVAWISERKDVLSGLFFMLTLLAYATYARTQPSSDPLGQPGSNSTVSSERLAGTLAPPTATTFAEPPRQRTAGTLHYWLALVAFALGLMSKPMLVTLPFVLLLLDVWPLGRFKWPPGWAFLSSRVFVEKLPFFALTLLASIATYLVQRSTGATSLTSTFPLEDRLGNAVLSYGLYLWKALWPANLGVLYPHPAIGYGGVALPDGEALLGLGLLWAGLGACAVVMARSRPWWFTGVFWFFGMLVPVIGLVQVGEQGMADRYAYLPLIGPVWAVAWAVSRVQWRMKHANWVLGTVAVSIVVACMLVTRIQLGHWRDTVSLFRHTIAVTPPNPSAHFALALGYDKAGRTEEAVSEYRKAVAIAGGHRLSQLNLGQLFRRENRWAEAATEYEALLNADPGYIPALLNLSQVYQELNRGVEALECLNQVLARDTDNVEALNNLAWLLATHESEKLRDPRRAVTLAERAAALAQDRWTTIIGTLAASYASAGRYEEAAKTAEKACRLAEARGETGLLQKNRELLEKYKALQRQ